MLEILKQLWKENEGKIDIRITGTAYSDDNAIVLIKNRVWVRGPIFFDDVPIAQFPVNNLDDIQGFLIEILTSPIKRDLSENLDYDNKNEKAKFLAKLGVKSIRQAVEKYKNVGFRVVENSLIVTPTFRDYNAKAWMESGNGIEIREPAWMRENLGAKAVLEALRLSK